MSKEFALLKCNTCGVLPELETQTDKPTLKQLRDGAYQITLGRYKCPACGAAPTWGRSYSTHDALGRRGNVAVWNRLHGERKDGEG